MSLFTGINEDVTLVAMFDAHFLLSRTSAHPFNLDNQTWPTVEHYYLAMRFENQNDKDIIQSAKSVAEAQKLSKRWFKKKRADWKKVETVVMTRALYTKCKTYPEIAQALLDTGNEALVESSVYDHFWGCGRDQRGDNHYGIILMNIRDKLRSELA
ncbi:NADAR family protein [Algibacillus agarilyticus]|uniref:NADAR family protein n=1 Tax=Algibacillus agarilyticus TaxID=2234133 RepID=UPI0018E54A04|nr:NADAR family protein [Algibacillus agarilyticus]